MPGPKNIAHSLSRLLQPQSFSNSETEEYVKFVAKAATPVAMITCDVERVSEGDPELQSLRKCILTGNWNQCEFKEYLPVRKELCSIGQRVLRGTRTVIPKKLRQQVLEIAHEGHPGIVSMKQRLKCKVW